MHLAVCVICGTETGTKGPYLAVFSVDVAFACHFMAPHHPTLYPYKSTCGTGYASKITLKWQAIQLAIHSIVGV